MFVAYIHKIKRSYRLTVTGEQIRKLFVDQPLLVKKFLNGVGAFKRVHWFTLDKNA